MKKIFLFVVLFLGITCFSFAQQLSNANKNALGSVLYADLSVAKNTTPDVIFHNILKINTNNSFTLLRTFQDNAGYTHETYQQFYKGVKNKIFYIFI